MYKLISVVVVCIAISALAGGAVYSQDKNASKDGPKPEEKKETATQEPEKKAHETTFYDLKITSKRLIFVIDVSASMLISAKEGSRGFGGGFGGGAWGSGGGIKESSDSRLAVAKKELTNAINALSDDAVFNIVVFHQKVSVWKDEIVRATKENKDEAVKWIDELKVGGGTFIYDALEKAFELQVKKEDAEALGIKPTTTTTASGSKTTAAFADAIYLLSDGDPSGGKIKEPDKIREEIKKMNKDIKLKINSISIGQDNELMKNLAKDSKGEYKVATNK